MVETKKISTLTLPNRKGASVRQAVFGNAKSYALVEPNNLLNLVVKEAERSLSGFYGQDFPRSLAYQIAQPGRTQPLRATKSTNPVLKSSAVKLADLCRLLKPRRALNRVDLMISSCSIKQCDYLTFTRMIGRLCS
jgi:hypothetical protein